MFGRIERTTEKTETERETKKVTERASSPILKQGQNFVLMHGWLDRGRGGGGTAKQLWIRFWRKLYANNSCAACSGAWCQMRARRGGVSKCDFLAIVWTGCLLRSEYHYWRGH